MRSANVEAVIGQWSFHFNAALDAFHRSFESAFLLGPDSVGLDGNLSLVQYMSDAHVLEINFVKWQPLNASNRIGQPVFLDGQGKIVHSMHTKYPYKPLKLPITIIHPNLGVQSPKRRKRQSVHTAKAMRPVMPSEFVLLKRMWKQLLSNSHSSGLPEMLVECMECACCGLEVSGVAPRCASSSASAASVSNSASIVCALCLQGFHIDCADRIMSSPHGFPAVSGALVASVPQEFLERSVLCPLCFSVLTK